MKRLILLVIIGNLTSFGHSQVVEDWMKKELQVKEEVVLEIPKSEIVVKLIEKEYYRNIYPTNTYSTLYVYCRCECRELKRSKIMEIFAESTYKFEWVINERTVDSLFQNLYYWIKEIEDFAKNYKWVGETITMKYYYELNTPENDCSYFLDAHSHYITIYTLAFFRDQKGYVCFRSAKMNLKTITELKTLLLNYTTNHKININL